MDAKNAGCRMIAACITWLAQRPRRWYLGMIARSSALLLIFIATSTLLIQYSVVRLARGRTFQDEHRINGQHVGLVFGCDDRFQDRENLYFTYRMDAAAALWKAGKLQCLIVSGDNRSMKYNEPQKMKRALMERGVPSEKIVCDYAGLRTLDSVIRAHTVFGVRKCLMISQLFQNERAIYIAEAHGIEAIGYNAKDVTGPGGRKTKWREFAARMMMWIDIHVLHTQPKHGGPREYLPI
jgi:SanA protein